MTSFVRDRITWLAYLKLAFFAYMIATLGPLMPFLRSELGLNYTVAAFHLSAMAIGMTLAGLTADRVSRRWGQRTMLWSGGAGLIAGGLALIAGRVPPLTISGAFLMGLFGSYVAVVVQVILTDRYGARRSIALTESNGAASVGAACAPILIGLGELTGVGWRASLVVGSLFWLALVFVYRRAPVPSKQASTVEGGKRSLPRRFWAYWLVILFGVAIEWCVEFWGADFLITVVGLEKVSAVSLMTCFFGAMLLGRIIGSRLARSVDAHQLLIGTVGVVLLGFPLFWLGRTPALNIVGLFISGLGIANLFPLTASVATGIDLRQSSVASARISLASGFAILVAPQVLGSLADRAGIYGAFGVAAALLVAITIIIVFAGNSRVLHEAAV